MKRANSVAALAALVAWVSACVSTQGYVGPRRDFSEIARVECMSTQNAGVDGTFLVRLNKVNGSTALGKWKVGTDAIDLLPGTYALDLDTEWRGGGVILMSDRFNRKHPRRIELAVDAGHSYFIRFDLDAEFYFMLDIASPHAMRPDSPPSGSAERCELALTHEDREICEATRSAE